MRESSWLRTSFALLLAAMGACTSYIDEPGGSEESLLRGQYTNVAVLSVSRDLVLLPLADGTVNPFDGASASIEIFSGTRIASDGTTSERTRASLRLRDAAPNALILAHAHVGPCANSGGHYQDVVGGATDETNEVHFDGEVGDDGYARVSADVVFRIRPAEALSVIFHLPPLADGSKPKAACLPLSL